MATFPEFRLTGPTISLEDKPLEFKPLNLLPLIELLRESKQPIGKSSSGEKSGKKEDEIKGRIGAVEQYQNALDKEMNIVNKGLQLYGSSFVDTPEYKSAMSRYERLSSDERKNIIERQTKDVDQFKEQIKDKGSFYHLGQWINSGFSKNQLKKVSDWRHTLERGYTDELGPEKGDYNFMENFDYTPLLVNQNNARDEADKIYDPAVAGSVSDKQFGESFVAKKIDKLYGSVKTEIESLNERNYGKRIEGYDDKKNPITTDVGVTEAYNQAIARAFNQAFDPSDVLTQGYLQGFVQSNSGNMDDYYDKKGMFDIKKFGNDFAKYMQEDLIKHYNKRRKDKNEYSEKSSFTEASSEAYKALNEEEETSLMLNSQKEELISLAETTNLGLKQEDLFPETGTFFTPDDIQSIMNLSEENSPFIYNAQEKGKSTMVNINPNFDMRKIGYNTNSPVFNELYDKFKKIYPKENDETIYARTTNAVLKLNEKVNLLNQRISTGQGVVGNTRENFTVTFIPTTEIRDSWWGSVNNSNLIGQTAEDVAHGAFIQIGNTYLAGSKLGKNLTYGGAEGSIYFQPNQMPSNLETYYLDDNQKLVTLNWADSKWQGLPEYEKNKILAKAREQEKQNPMLGTKFRHSDGQPSTTVKHDPNKTFKIDKYTANLMAMYVSNANLSNNAIHAAPGAVVQNAKFYGKDEATIIKALEGYEIDVERPYNYGSNKEFKKIYDNLFSSWDGWLSGEQGKRQRIINNKRFGFQYFSENSSEAVKATEKEYVLKTFGIPDNQKELFWKHWQSMPAGTPKYKLEDLVVTSVNNQNIQNWNWNKTTPILTKTPVVVNGKINPEASNYVSIQKRIPTASDKNQDKAYIILPMNMTPVVAKSSNKIAQGVVTGGISNFEKNNIRATNPTESNKFSLVNPQKN